METKFKSIATLQEGNYYIMPHETGLHTDESKGLTKKGESRKPLHDYVQDLCSLTNIGQCPYNEGHERPNGLFWHHTPTGQMEILNIYNANMLLFWLTVQTGAAGQPPELERLWH